MHAKRHPPASFNYRACYLVLYWYYRTSQQRRTYRERNRRWFAVSGIGLSEWMEYICTLGIAFLADIATSAYTRCASAPVYLHTKEIFHRLWNRLIVVLPGLAAGSSTRNGRTATSGETVRFPKKKKKKKNAWPKSCSPVGNQILI